MNNTADLKLIKWVLETQTAYKINKDIGIAQTTISQWNTGKTPLIKMSLENAIKLTEYAKEIRKRKLK